MARSKSKGARKKKKSSWLRPWQGWLLKLLLLAGGGACLFYFVWAWSLDLGRVGDMVERSIIYDMDGRFYSRLEGQNRSPVPFSKISPFFIKALLAREDTRFYQHHGVDPVGILRAMARNVVHLHAREGASTITQQLARNTFPLGGRNLHRKILEAFVAVRLENNFSKEELLEHYINRIYFGSGCYGLQAASLAYFNKPASELDLSESAMLAGLIRSPTRFSPWNNLKGAYVQRDTVLERMRDLGMISPEQARSAMEAEVKVTSQALMALLDNYALDLVKSEIEQFLTDEQIAEGGLRIHTTIDSELQKAAQDSVDKQLEAIEAKPGYNHVRRAEAVPAPGGRTPYLQGALTVIDNRSGGLRALVGGRNHGESTFNRALLARRQIGSTFKPFVYAAAFGRGLQPQAPIEDGPIARGEIRGAPSWNPSNSDGTYRGTMPVADGLVFSRNTVSARVGNYAGIQEVAKVASAAGLGEIPKMPAVYLGAFESSVKELTLAYSIFPNLGIRKQPYIVERIEDQDGRVLFRATHGQVRVLAPETCSQLNAILQQVLERGTAASASSLGLKKTAAGKTGTTNDFRDAWFVGYTRSLTCGVWVGFDQPQTIVQRGYGAALALPIWVDVVNAASAKKYPSGGFDAAGGGLRNAPSDFMRSLRKIFGGH